MEKLPIFDQKSWTNPFAKNTNFRLFKVLVFIVYKRRFSFLEYRETHFPAYFALNKRIKNLTTFDQNH